MYIYIRKVLVSRFYQKYLDFAFGNSQITSNSWKIFIGNHVIPMFKSKFTVNVGNFTVNVNVCLLWLGKCKVNRLFI